MNNQKIYTKQNKMDRNTFLKILEFALQTKSYRFLRQSSEYWLMQYPGDLLVNLWQARGMFAEGKRSEAITQLENLILLDPEFLEAYQLLGFALSGNLTEHYVEVMACIHALGGHVRASISLPAWSGKLLETREAIDKKDVDESMQLISQVLGRGVKLPLIDVTHLRASALSQDKVTIKQLAEVYYSRWQNGLQFMLFMADAKLEMGDETGAIEMLHKCASMDSAGQVPERLWGSDHAYKPLWVNSLEVPFDIQIPSTVAALMGLNQLPEQIAGSEEVLAESDAVEDAGVESETTVQTEQSELEESSEKYSRQVVAKPVSSQPNVVLPKEQPVQKKTETVGGNGKKDAFTSNVEQIFDRLAIKLKQPKLSNADGRFPNYVILTSKTALIEKYGPQTFVVLDAEMQSLANAVKLRHGWDALIYYPDDPICTAKYGIDSIENNDPWKIKLSIADLDKNLATKGSMVGALMIVGGPDIVPFHKLPNPAGDMDTEVPSDNPYGTLSSNYFVPEFPVGRLPDESGDDAGLLLGQLRRIIQNYTTGAKSKSASLWQNVFYSIGFLVEIITNLFNKKEQVSVLAKSMGYTAAIWQRSSIAAYRPLGQPQSMRISPPEDVKSIPSDLVSGSYFEYYNLHGVENGAEWYGQRDVTEDQTGPEYPVALHPDLIKKNGKSPQIIFSEACFGGNVYGKTYSNAISLKFISIGTEIVVASTCTAYGSVSTPLIGADLLGYLYWKYLVDGYASGEALLYAKIDFAKEMNRRQGYLDGEDQKTLLSFVLYGDPLSKSKGINHSNMKGSTRRREAVQYDVISENASEVKSVRFSPDTIAEMKSLLSPYLPGLSDEDLHYMKQNISKFEMVDQSEKPEMVVKGVRKTGNVVMSVNKEYRIAQQIHRHYARVTINPSGKLMKIAISR